MNRKWYDLYVYPCGLVKAYVNKLIYKSMYNIDFIQSWEIYSHLKVIPKYVRIYN